MSRQMKNVEQIRSLLGKMDRLIDDARNKREGGGRAPQPMHSINPMGNPLGNPVGHAPATAVPMNRPATAPPPPLRTNAAPANHLGAPSNGNAHGNGNGNSHLPAQSPQRLKAKPKSRPSDPLQDFQQRQAS
jgi:hypothetical protein